MINYRPRKSPRKDISDRNDDQGTNKIRDEIREVHITPNPTKWIKKTPKSSDSVSTIQKRVFVPYFSVCCLNQNESFLYQEIFAFELRETFLACRDQDVRILLTKEKSFLYHGIYLAWRHFCLNPGCFSCKQISFLNKESVFNPDFFILNESNFYEFPYSFFPWNKKHGIPVPNPFFSLSHGSKKS